MSFCALTILCELRRRLKRPFFEMAKAGGMKKKHTPLNDEMTFNAMLNYQDSVKLRYGN